MNLAVMHKRRVSNRKYLQHQKFMAKPEIALSS